MLEVDSSGVIKATGNLTKFAEMAGKASKSTGDLEKKTATLDDVMGQFNMSVIANAAGVMGLVKAMKSLASSLKGMISNYAHFESMQKGLETFFQSADLGKQKFEELRKLSNTTTFGVDELANSFTQLANVGVDVDTINDKLIMLGNISGGNKQKFADLVTIYSKIISVGKAGSEQIQMLARQGVPIYDTLKKMGVTGTATGKQITEALQSMTKEGGQFYNAMNNINETIEGKEGFISDYFKEFTVNFAEASGIADAYKTVLDILKEAIGGISDKLLELNKNPVLKALFQGTLATAMTLLVSLIGVAMVAALAKVLIKLKAIIADLTIINILKGPAGWATLAAAGVVGVTVAVAGLTKGLKEADEKAEKLAKSMGKGGKGIGKNSIDAVSNLQTQKDSYINKVTELRGEKAAYAETASSRYFSYADEEDQKLILNKIAAIDEEIEKYRTLISLADKRIERLNAITERNKEVNSFVEDINDNYDIATIGKKQAEFDKIKTQLNEFNEKYSKLSPYITDESKDKFNALINEWQDKLKELEIDIDFESNPWKKDLQKILGLTGDEVNSLYNNGGFTGKSSAELYGKKNIQSQKNTADAYSLMGFTQSNDDLKNIAIAQFNDIKEKILTLANTPGFDVNNDNVFKGLNTQLQDTVKSLSKFGIEVDKSGNIVEEQSEPLKDFMAQLKEWTDKQIADGNIAGAAGGTLAQQSGDVNNFAQGMQSGGIWGGIIATVIGALANVCQGIEGFDEVMNPVTTLFQNLSEVIRFIISLISSLLTIIKAVAKIINTVIKVLRPVLAFIEVIIELIAGFIEAIANCIESLLSFIPWVDKAADAEEEKDKDLRDAYKSLIDAMKEQEEEYEKRKKELNADNYAGKVTGVHDMILTPQGQFSTDPDDYIIATKNPGGLNGGVSVIQLQPIINNTIADSAQVTTSSETDENGMVRMLVTISRKIASDYVSGENGWDSAVSARSYRQSGRSLAM